MVQWALGPRAAPFHARAGQWQSERRKFASSKRKQARRLVRKGKVQEGRFASRTETGNKRDDGKRALPLGNAQLDVDRGM